MGSATAITGSTILLIDKDQMVRLLHKHSAETCVTMSAAQKGKTFSVEHRAKISAACKGKPSALKGRTLSVEHRAKMSAAHKGKPGRIPSAEARAKMSAAHKGKPSLNKGRKHSAESRLHMSKAHKGLPTWNKGKTGMQHHSDATRANMSMAQRARYAKIRAAKQGA